MFIMSEVTALVRSIGFFSCESTSEYRFHKHFFQFLNTSSKNTSRFAHVYFNSLLRALMSNQLRTQPLTGEEITDGIDIKNWTVRHSSGQEMTFSAWDFAGQTVYYNTHQVGYLTSGPHWAIVETSLT